MINNVDIIPSETLQQDATVILITKEQFDKKSFSLNHKLLKDIIVEQTKDTYFKAGSGQEYPLTLNKNVLLLVGLGNQKEITSTSLKIAIKKALSSPTLNESNNIELICHNQKETTIKAAIEAALIGTYAWTKYKSKTNDKEKTTDKSLYIIASKNKAFDEHKVICESTNYTRNLVNDNADVVTSKLLESCILNIIDNQKNISIEILNEKELKSKGLNLHLGVNQGSNKEPKLIIVRYQGGKKKDPFTALVGKGITFDAGGLNLKPTGSIECMREDMGGAGAVIGALRNTISLKLKKNIIFAVGLAENAIGSGAQKPGDVVIGYAKKSVEIANTDAEGRLVLADAISYINKNYSPDTIINIATLTGACMVALGYDYTGLVSNNDNLSKKLIKSANDTDDRAWPLPSYPELKDSVKSQIADIKNLGYARGIGGAITAAEFLRQFVGETKWAHLDIAGTAFVEGSSRMYYGHGATGAGVRLLTHYIQNN